MATTTTTTATPSTSTKATNGRTPFLILPNTDERLIFGIQALRVCTLTYNNEDQLLPILLGDKKCRFGGRGQKYEEEKKKLAKEFQQTNIQFAKVEEFHLWNEEIDFKHMDDLVISQCVTGIVTLDNGRRLPFVAFRGSVSKVDWFRDFISFSREHHKTQHGNTVPGEVGLGFSIMLRKLREVKNPETNRKLIAEIMHLSKDLSEGLLIIGHSLGAACANVFFAELLTDYEDKVTANREKIHVVTFGGPRSFTVETAQFVNKAKIEILRFVNNDDIITKLPPPEIPYVHVGTPFFAAVNGSYPRDDEVRLGMTRWHEVRGLGLGSNFAANGFSNLQEYFIKLSIPPTASPLTHLTHDIAVLMGRVRPLGYSRRKKHHDIVDANYGYSKTFQNYEKGCFLNTTAIALVENEHDMVVKGNIENPALL